MNKILIALFFFLSSLHTVELSPELTARVIGSGSPYYNEKRASACVLISQGDTHVLLDMGNGTQARLHALEFDVREVSALLFTHHHLDHNEEFVPILIRSILGRQDFSIIGPPQTEILATTNLKLYAEDIDYRLGKTGRTLAERSNDIHIRDISGGERFSIGDISVSTLQVPHTIHTIVYRFDYKETSIVVTGDLTYTDALPAFAQQADFMVIDSGGMIMSTGKRAHTKGRKMKENTGRHVRSANAGQKEGSGKKRARKERAHLNLEDSSSLAEQAGVHNLVYTHFTEGEINKEASIRKIQEKYHGNIIFAEDLLLIESDASSDEISLLPTINYDYPIVDTHQTLYYSDTQRLVPPQVGQDFYGQDAHYTGNQPSYIDNGDGTVTDVVTGLMWQKSMGAKMTFEEAQEQVALCITAGYRDWRIPHIKELYSLILFTGKVQGQHAKLPFIATKFFAHPLGNTQAGERQIDAQTWSATHYCGTTMRSDATIFGVNFVDGRIKGYPKFNPRTSLANSMYFRFVRGNKKYGTNSFVDNNNGTITDTATGLMWQQNDSTYGMDWKKALAYAEKLELAGHTDWCLPNAKELQSVVDYTRSIQSTQSPAIHSSFFTTQITNPLNEIQYPYFWTSTSHQDGPNPNDSAVYIAFGEALGKMHNRIMDVHGAGAQRSDPKSGKVSDYPQYFGPQGDIRIVYNFVRCVRTCGKKK